MKVHTGFIIVFLILLSLLPLVGMFAPGLPVTHDGPDHVARIANFYQALSEGVFVPRWAANLNWGYGHPILMFLYPLPSYVASGLHALGFGFVSSTKGVFILAYIASVLTFFWWAGEVWGRWAGIVGALIYGFSPYRFVDLYVRGAIGEHVAFVFAPLLLLGVYRLAQAKKSGVLILTLGWAGLLLSHNAISLMVFPIVLCYIVYLYFFQAQRKISFIFWTVGSLGVGFLLSAFFWIPALIEGKYTLRNIVTSREYAERFVLWKDFFSTTWSYGGSDDLSKSLGIFGWIVVIASFIRVLFVRSAREKVFVVGVLFVLFGTLFIMTGGSLPLWRQFTILQNFQFPWRFLELTVLLVASLGSSLIFHLGGSVQKLGAAVLMLGVIASSLLMWQAKSYTHLGEPHYSGIYNSTTDTGESSPIWSVRFMEHRPKAPAEVIQGDAQITHVGRTTTKHRYMVLARERSRILENTLYFPGWVVRVDGTPIQTEFQDPQYRGLMTFWIEQGKHVIEVSFTDTKVRKLSTVISLVGVMILIGFVGTRLWQKK